LNKPPSTRNDLTAAVPQFCFGLEAHRRTPEGRVRSAQEFVAHFFPYDARQSKDRIFRLMPNDVRAPILTTWGVRGKKSAFRDDDGKVQSVIHDALVAGDIDATMFEAALSPDIIMRWIELPDWWAFWRAGKILTHTLLKALESAYELGLFDAEWFLDTLRGGGGKLRGTDVLAEGLSKSDLTEWVRNVHQSQDGSAKGLITALGWDQIASKTADDILLAVIDALAVKVSLALTTEPTAGPGEPPTLETKTVDKKAEPPPKVETKADAPSPKVEVAPPPAAPPKAEPSVQVKVEARPEVKPSVVGAPPPKVDPKPVARPEAKPEATPAPGAAAAAPPAGGEMPTVKPPNVMVPWMGLPGDDQKELAFDDKEDDLIPISAPSWEDGEEVEVEAAEIPPRPTNRRSKPPGGKRPSRAPPGK